jgi:hypothetical protein
MLFYSFAYLTVCAHGSNVDRNQDKPEYQAERPSGEVIGPVLQNQLKRD